MISPVRSEAVCFMAYGSVLFETSRLNCSSYFPFGSLISRFSTNANTPATIIIRNVLTKEPLASYNAPAMVLPKDAISKFMLMMEKFTG